MINMINMNENKKKYLVNLVNHVQKYFLFC
jgi:hypothetical protein